MSALVDLDTAVGLDIQGRGRQGHRAVSILNYPACGALIADADGIIDHLARRLGGQID